MKESFSADAVKKSLAGIPEIKKIYYKKILDSTNLLAKELALEGAPSGTLVIADEQSKGRGRKKRSWFSPPRSGLWFSLILQPEEVHDYSLLTTAAGVAAAKAIKKACDMEVKLRWPNDLILNGKKCGGILVESRLSGTKPKFFIAGMGINVNIEKKNFPSQLKSAATSLLIESRKRISRTSLLEEIIKELFASLKKQSNEVIKEAKEFSEIMGKKVKITSGREIIEGVAENLSSSGSIIIKTESGDMKEILTCDRIKIVKELRGNAPSPGGQRYSIKSSHHRGEGIQ
ncbi:MAG: biotin--[acetyl-CoA-carboxylase] ligase [Firmicutes bacterium]|nr:biotin--[acetyl-CoA-carboxylase] ligase [Bacillota bacterium]